MTIEGAIAQLQELIDNDEIPFWAKPSLQNVMETVEMEREQRIEESKTGKWINHKDEHQCSICGEVVIGEVYDGEWGSNGIYEYCPYCGARMKGEGDETD